MDGLVNWFMQASFIYLASKTNIKDQHVLLGASSEPPLKWISLVW